MVCLLELILVGLFHLRVFKDMFKDAEGFMGRAHVEADFTLGNSFTRVFTNFLLHQLWVAHCAARDGAGSTLVSASKKAIVPLLSLINQSPLSTFRSNF